MIVIEFIFWMLMGLVAYVYVGYPLLLRFLCFVTGGKTVRYGEHRPAVTLVVSAFNEDDVIAQKIVNSLQLDYPQDLLEILIVSDASDDGTDGIVQGYAADGVRLLRMQDRSGKTLGLNEAVKVASGNIIVFSDANAMYKPDAINALVRNFHDPNVGAVVGESTYSDSSNDAEKSESAYWRYETAIKHLESRLGSVVGGDGAIYAIRKEFYRPMSADALSDFVNPCQIVEQGKRCLYEPDAISVEEAAGSFDKEFGRKVRIVNRAWRATMSMKHLLNPFRYGFFAIELLSHKLLRWLVPAMLIVLLVANLFLVAWHSVYQVTFGLQLLFYSLAVVGKALSKRHELPMVLYIPYYFSLVNIASALGILDAYRGKTYTTWSTARADKHAQTNESCQELDTGEIEGALEHDILTVNKLREILRDTLQLGNRADDLNELSPLLGDIPELDSMAVAAVLTMVEEEFGIEIDDEEVSSEIFETVGALSTFVSNKVRG